MDCVCNVYTHTHIHTHTHMFTCTYIRIYLRTHVHVYMYVDTVTCFKHTHTLTHTNTHIHTHTHSHTHTHRCFPCKSGFRDVSGKRARWNGTAMSRHCPLLYTYGPNLPSRYWKKMLKTIGLFGVLQCRVLHCAAVFYGLL